MSSASTNPLLSKTPSGFPLWRQITPSNVAPAMELLLADMDTSLAALEANVEPTWAGLVDPYESLGDDLGRAWGQVCHLKAVKDTEELRTVHSEIQPKVVALSLKVSQSPAIYKAFVELKESQGDSLSEAQLRAVDKVIRSAELSGVGLEGTAKERFNEVQQELSQLSTQFGNNLLDSTKVFAEVITDKEGVAGLPGSALDLAAQTAKKKGQEDATAEEGPWVFTLDAPSYVAVVQHARNRDLREKVYKAYLTRASSGEADNTPLIDRILTLKQEKAELLGYANYGEVSLSSKMATLDKALGLLDDIVSKSYDAAVADLEAVRAFAATAGAPEAEEGLKHWDIAFWAERQREALYDLKDEELRPYFQLPAVLDGLFSLATKLFNVRILPADGASETWHDDVRFFRLEDATTGELVSHFYLDPYSRPEEKRGGAWMNDVQGRSAALAPEGAAHRLPIAHMVCNQSSPVGDKPSLMSHREVETVFHEFGHALQHMLTTQDCGLVSGIENVEWDAVELPSQFMENWTYHKKTLQSIAKHYETGEVLPDDLYNKIVAARSYRAGSQMLRQCHFALTDLTLHTQYTPGGAESVFDVERRVAKRTCVVPPLPEDRFLCGFSHIFAGGYAAGYYSYKWAEVLSADAFGAFEDAGLDDEAIVEETGRRFRDTVLSLGGGRDPLSVFVDFRGREPSADALLRHNGLVSSKL